MKFNVIAWTAVGALAAYAVATIVTETVVWITERSHRHVPR